MTLADGSTMKRPEPPPMLEIHKGGFGRWPAFYVWHDRNGVEIRREKAPEYL